MDRIPIEKVGFLIFFASLAIFSARFQLSSTKLQEFLVTNPGLECPTRR